MISKPLSVGEIVVAHFLTGILELKYNYVFVTHTTSATAAGK
jgi:hypothetical protein